MAEYSSKFLEVHIVMVSLPSEETTLPAFFITEKGSATGDIHYLCIDNSFYSGVGHRRWKECYKASELNDIGRTPLKGYSTKWNECLNDLPERDWQVKLRPGSVLGKTYVNKVLTQLKNHDILDIHPEGQAWIDSNLLVD